MKHWQRFFLPWSSKAWQINHYQHGVHVSSTCFRSYYLFGIPVCVLHTD